MMETERLILRNWKDGDHDPFSELNADPKVMEFFPKLMSPEESRAFIDKTKQLIGENGYGLWALERKDTGEFIGFTGLHRPRFDAHFTPCVEIGWRLAHEHWGNGFADEAARASLDYGFRQLQLDEVVSFTTPENVRSRRLMERLGMVYEPSGDFDHPNVDANSPFCKHVLYRLRSDVWLGPK